MIQCIKTKSHEEWVRLRHKYIGGSDAAAVVGMNHYKSAYTLFCEKRDMIPPFTGNLATEVGTYLEEFVAKKFEKETGKTVRRNNRSLINDLYPFAIANIDREIVGEDAGLEIKTTSELNLRAFKNGEYPDNYYVQCMHYLAVTGKKKWYLAVLIGNRDFKIFEIERDEEEISALMEAEKEFWHCVETGKLPGVDGSKSTSNSLQTVYAESNSESVDLTALDADFQAMFSLEEQIKRLELEKDECKNRICAYMGSAETGSSERFSASWKPQKRNVFDVSLFAKEHPDLDLSNYYKISEARIFRKKKLA